MGIRSQPKIQDTFSELLLISKSGMLHDIPVYKSYRKAMNRNWSNQKANPALKTKTGSK